MFCKRWGTSGNFGISCKNISCSRTASYHRHGYLGDWESGVQVFPLRGTPPPPSWSPARHHRVISLVRTCLGADARRATLLTRTCRSYDSKDQRAAVLAAVEDKPEVARWRAILERRCARRRKLDAAGMEGCFPPKQKGWAQQGNKRSGPELAAIRKSKGRLTVGAAAVRRPLCMAPWLNTERPYTFPSGAACR